MPSDRGEIDSKAKIRIPEKTLIREASTDLAYLPLPAAKLLACAEPHDNRRTHSHTPAGVNAIAVRAPRAGTRYS